MIEHAWKWAAEHNKLKKSEINGAEYATLPVDQMRTKTEEASSSLTMKSQAVFEDSFVGEHTIAC